MVIVYEINKNDLKVADYMMKKKNLAWKLVVLIFIPLKNLTLKRSKNILFDFAVPHYIDMTLI